MNLLRGQYNVERLWTATASLLPRSANPYSLPPMPLNHTPPTNPYSLSTPH